MSFFLKGCNFTLQYTEFYLNPRKGKGWFCTGAEKKETQTPRCCYEWAKWRWLPLQPLSSPKGREGRQGAEVGLQGESSQGSFTERSVGNGTGTNQHYSIALWVNISHIPAFFSDSSVSFHSTFFIWNIWTVSLENVYSQVTTSSFVNHCASKAHVSIIQCH